MKCWKIIMLENMKYQGEFIGAKTVIYVSQSSKIYQHPWLVEDENPRLK